MKILILGDDGRAHALVWKFFISSDVELLCGPGNGGAAQLVPQVEINPLDAAEVARWAFDEQVDMIIPADGAALHAGLADEVLSMHLGVFGPPRRATRIAQSRCFAKELLLRYSLPTPAGRPFSELATAERYLAAQALPVTIRGDRPDAPGGVYEDRYAALEALRALFARLPPGTADEPQGVVIEESVQGVPISFSAITDGTTVVPLLPVRIYDHFGEGDSGELAPGMGAHTGVSTYARKLGEYLHQKLMLPLVAALAREGLPYWGILGIDCVITTQGPRIIALRTAMRDLEAQVVLPRLEGALLPLCEAAIARRLDQVAPLQWRDEATLAIALVVNGYPYHGPVGLPIKGLTDLDEGVLAFHHQTSNPAGMRYNPAAPRANPLYNLIMRPPSSSSLAITTTGGHVLTIVASSATLNGARGRALLNAERITFSGRYFRGDIGAREFT